MRQFFIREPFRWFQSCFFQPGKFKEEVEATTLSHRLVMMLRLAPLLFLYTYPLALITRIILYSVNSDLYNYPPVSTFMPLNPTYILFVFDATWATALSCLIAALFCGCFTLRFGIATALALSLANGIIVNTGDDTLVAIVYGVAFGLLLGITFNSANAVRQGGIEYVTIASLLGVVSGLLIGGCTGIVGGYWSGFYVGMLYPFMQNKENIWGSTAGLVVGSIAAILIAFFLGILVQRRMRQRDAAVSVGTRISIAVAAAFGSAVGIPVGDTGVKHYPFLAGVIDGINSELLVGLFFLFFYLLCYYRLPLYPISAYSTLQAYLASRHMKHNVLYALRNSSLHWDECVFLPLPYLKTMLLLSAEQNVHETLNEMSFIIQQRPQQRQAALETAYELALNDLQQRLTLRDISQAQQQLAFLLPREVRDADAHALSIFRALYTASGEAASYTTQTYRQHRQEALDRMNAALHTIAHSTFRNPALTQQLRTVIRQWTIAAEQGKETLGTITGSLSMSNPYAPGNPLELHDPLFVGRNDIIQKMGQALQQRYRPTFLLTGERRMGKSSIIKQLPVLLGPRYIPIFYDLQTPGILATIAAFFDAIISGVEKQFQSRRFPFQKLERRQLDEAQQQSELAVYDLFEQWLRGIEQTLEETDRTLILAFDEFEKLVDAEDSTTLNLELLFDLFRSIMQNRPRFALLFSGAKMVGDMGLRWVGYFVNVERIKVGFLHEADAHDLIVNPVPAVFSEEITQEIMRITYCHPFLVQALCKQIIEILISETRAVATMEDVARAVKEVFETWTSYFWDLWNRCDLEQRRCLLTLHTLSGAEIETITLHTGLERQSILFALEKLQMRDMVLHEHAHYRIAVPLFAQWLAANRHLLSG